MAKNGNEIHPLTEAELAVYAAQGLEIQRQRLTEELARLEGIRALVVAQLTKRGPGRPRKTEQVQPTNGFSIGAYAKTEAARKAASRRMKKRWAAARRAGKLTLSGVSR